MFRSRLSREAFTQLLRLFVQNVESYRIAEEIGVSRVTVSKILAALRRRMATYARRLEAPGRRIVYPDELLLRAHPRHVRGRRPTAQGPVAAVACGRGVVSSDLILEFPRALWRYLDLELGALEFVDSSGIFGDSVALLDLQTFELISLARPRESEGVRFRGNEIALVADFAGFAGEHFRKARGIPEDKVWLHLAEAEYRFNRREQDIEALLIEMLQLEPLRLSA